ncbi:MAG TPA: hypothetical protein VMR89_08730 [Actinomycetota bacterium]|nr:hypothetical protein [Actinomycetota bacterium]
MKVRPAAASLVLFLALSACADAPVDPGAGDGIDHSTAPDDVLVRIEFEGGFTPIEWTYTNMPSFALYGDGTLVLPGAQIEIYPAPALPAISARRIGEPGIQAFLEEILDALATIPADLNDLGFMYATDVPTTVITVSAGGVDRTIRAYGLAELTERPEGMPEEEYRARVRLQELVTKLGTLETWLPEGSLGPESAYEASGARLFAGKYRKVDLPQDPSPWPLEGALATFGETTDDLGLYRCGVVEGSDWTTVREAASRANQLTPWTDAEKTFSILFRPLLPDENGC